MFTPTSPAYAYRDEFTCSLPTIPTQPIIKIYIYQLVRFALALC
ncbi:Uncharacterised protein [Vibrio cholerae]|nr:Uncharacterised protein [Vibrio cholerae]